MSTLTTRQARERRHRRIRGKVAGTADRPRLAVFRSNKGIFAQLVDDESGRTVGGASWLGLPKSFKGSKVEQHIKAHLTGSGDLGNAYKLELDVRSTWDTSAMTMTHKNRYDLKSEGSAPDQRVEVTIRSSPLSIEIKPECRGVPKP